MNNEIVEILESLGSPKILVIGDLMIDHFIHGTVSRISPEAPTPVLAYKNETFQLGGAGFTANVLKQLGAEVDLAAVCGDDSGKDLLFKILEESSFSTDSIFTDSTRPTTRKQRFIANDADLSSGLQQMIRVDFESSESISEDIEQKIIAFLKSEGSKYDAIIASDYGKGMLTESLLKEVADCKSAVTAIFADPRKGSDIGNYKGFTAMKPNRYEAEACVGFPLDSKETIIKAGKTILKKAGLDYTFISLDAEGIFYINKDGEYLFVPTTKQEVYDVAGAGDSVISIMALLAGSKLPPRYLMEIANVAAGIMISQKQPKKISRQDIIKHIIVGDDKRKLKSPDELKAILNSGDSRERKVYFTNGYFDNINPLQIKFLEKMGLYEGIRVVAINSDSSIKEAGHDTLLDENDRIRLLQMFDCIDYLVVFDSASCDDLLEIIKPDVFLKGINYKNQPITEKETLDTIGCSIEFIDADS